MKRPGRGLLPDEAALWARVAQTVKPLDGGKAPIRPSEGQHADVPSATRALFGAALKAQRQNAAQARQPAAPPPPPRREDKPRVLDRHGLDAGWDRKLARGVVQPDFTLDLHGATLDMAYVRLDHGLTQALAQGARVVLLVTGRDRPSEDRRGRGAIRRKFMDWLIAGSHASRIAAVRPAHPRHGGAGAVYIVLKRAR